MYNFPTPSGKASGKRVDDAVIVCYHTSSGFIKTSLHLGIPIFLQCVTHDIPEYMNVKTHFKNTLLAGILTLVPLGVTYFVLRFLFITLDGWLAPVVSRILGEQYVTGMGLLATILLVYLTGVIVSNIVGRKLIGLGEKVLNRIPLVRDVYAPVRQLVQLVLGPEHSNKFKRVVAIESPNGSMRVIGFVTGQMQEKGNPTPLTSVFVPTSPNPTTGVLLFCNSDILHETNLKPETAMKMLVSGGVVAPDHFTIYQMFDKNQRD